MLPVALPGILGEGRLAGELMLSRIENLWAIVREKRTERRLRMSERPGPVVARKYWTAWTQHSASHAGLSQGKNDAHVIKS